MWSTFLTLTSNCAFLLTKAVTALERHMLIGLQSALTDLLTTVRFLIQSALIPADFNDNSGNTEYSFQYFNFSLHT